METRSLGLGVGSGLGLGLGFGLGLTCGDEVVRGGGVLGPWHVGEVGGESQAQLQRCEERLVEARRCRGVGELGGGHLVSRWSVDGQ